MAKNLAELEEKAKSARRAVKDFRYYDTPLTFRMKVIDSNELDNIAELAKRVKEEKQSLVYIKELLDLSIIQSWEKMTIRLFAEISNLEVSDLASTEEEKDEEVIVNSPEKANETAEQYFIRNTDFRLFLAESVNTLIAQRRQEAEAQKKILSITS